MPLAEASLFIAGTILCGQCIVVEGSGTYDSKKMTMRIDSDSDVPRVESGNTELRGQDGFSEECCAAQDVDVHVSEGQRPVISGAASQRLSFEEEHRPTPAASERLSIDEEYRPMPLGVRFRSEWDGKWGEASERVSW